MSPRKQPSQAAGAPTMEQWKRLYELAARIQELAPKEIRVHDPFLQALLGPIGQELGINIKKVSRLTAINRAKRELNRFIPGF